MAFALFQAPTMPKFDPAAAPRPNFAIQSITARRDIIITLVMQSRLHHDHIHALYDPLKAATLATKPQPLANPLLIPTHSAPSTPEQTLCKELNSSLDSYVSRLITALATILRIRYIHIPKRAHTSPEHAGYVTAARAHNTLLCQTREFAIALLTMVSKDDTASIHNFTAAANILIRLPTPLLDAADFNPAAAAAETTAAATTPAAVQAAPAASTLTTAPSPSKPAPFAPATAVKPAAPTLPKPAPKDSNPRNLEQKIAASNSAALLAHAG